MSRRPALTARRWVWKDQDRSETPGVGLMSRFGQLAAHLTPDECRALADTLHDLAEQIEQTQE